MPEKIRLNLVYAAEAGVLKDMGGYSGNLGGFMG